jgi:hypothetical protein
MTKTNEELLKQAYACTHHAGDQVSELEVAQASGLGLPVQEAADRLTKLKRNLQQALCAVTELERLARGGAPVKQG